MAIVKTMENASIIRGMDYRLLLAGALLPDIVDKSGAGIAIAGSVYEGRAFGHSLAFVALIAVLGGAAWAWRRWRWPQSFFLGALVHDILDVMWLHPGTFFWPLYGWDFPVTAGEAWQGTFVLFGREFWRLLGLEIIGLLLLLYFFMKVAASRGWADFLRKGRFVSEGQPR